MKALMHLALVCPWGVALFDPTVLSDFLRQNQAPQGSDVFEMLRQDPQLRAYALQDGLVLPMYPLEEDVYTFVHLNACPARVDWRFCHGPFPLLIESGRLVAADLFTLAHWDYELFERYHQPAVRAGIPTEWLPLPPGEYALTISGGLTGYGKTYGLHLAPTPGQLPPWPAPMGSLDFNL